MDKTVLISSNKPPGIVLIQRIEIGTGPIHLSMW